MSVWFLELAVFSFGRLVRSHISLDLDRSGRALLLSVLFSLALHPEAKSNPAQLDEATQSCQTALREFVPDGAKPLREPQRVVASQSRGLLLPAPKAEAPREREENSRPDPADTSGNPHDRAVPAEKTPPRQGLLTSLMNWLYRGTPLFHGQTAAGNQELLNKSVRNEAIPDKDAIVFAIHSVVSELREPDKDSRAPEVAPSIVDKALRLYKEILTRTLENDAELIKAGVTPDFVVVNFNDVRILIDAGTISDAKLREIGKTVGEEFERQLYELYPQLQQRALQTDDSYRPLVQTRRRSGLRPRYWFTAGRGENGSFNQARYASRFRDAGDIRFFRRFQDMEAEVLSDVLQTGQLEAAAISLVRAAQNNLDRDGKLKAPLLFTATNIYGNTFEVLSPQLNALLRKTSNDTEFVILAEARFGVKFTSEEVQTLRDYFGSLRIDKNIWDNGMIFKESDSLTNAEMDAERAERLAKNRATIHLDMEMVGAHHATWSQIWYHNRLLEIARDRAAGRPDSQIAYEIAEKLPEIWGDPSVEGTSQARFNEIAGQIRATLAELGIPKEDILFTGDDVWVYIPREHQTLIAATLVQRLGPTFGKVRLGETATHRADSSVQKADEHTLLAAFGQKLIKAASHQVYAGSLDQRYEISFFYDIPPPSKSELSVVLRVLIKPRGSDSKEIPETERERVKTLIQKAFNEAGKPGLSPTRAEELLRGLDPKREIIPETIQFVTDVIFY